MIDLLQNDYIAHFGLTGNYTVVHHTVQGNVVFHDEIACEDCKNRQKQQCDAATDEQNFKLSSNSEVEVVDIEQFFNQFDGKRAGVSSRCDLMLYSNNKIAFVDMYCGQQKFVHPYINQKGLQEGKLAKVRKQITNTIDKLCEVPSIHLKVLLYGKKVGVFACRKKQALGEGTRDEENMQVFFHPTFETDAFTLLANGFEFFTVEYPDEFVW